MSEPEEEGAMEPALNEMSAEAVNILVLESGEYEGEVDLEWDDAGMSVGHNNLEDFGSEAMLQPGNKRRLAGSSPEPLADDGFTLVTRYKRRNLQRTPPSASPHPPVNLRNNFGVYITAKTDSLPKQLAFAKLLAKYNIQGIETIKYKSPFKLLIKFKTEQDTNNFLNNKITQDHEWVCRNINELHYCYGVVRDIDIDIEDKELKEIFECDTKILSIKRLLRKDSDGKWIKSETVRIGFEGSNLPEFIKAYGCRMAVDSYMHPVTQCSKCWRYGHVSQFCPSKTLICPKCGGKHENCETKSFRCVNCKGNHISFMKSVCPAFEKERNIRIYMGNHMCSYKFAVNKMKEETLKNTSSTLEPEMPRVIPITSHARTDGASAPTYRDVTVGDYEAVETLQESDDDNMELDECVSSVPNQESSTTSEVKKKNKNKSKKRSLEVRRNNEDVSHNLVITSAEIHAENQQDEKSSSSTNRKERKRLLEKILDKIREVFTAEGSLKDKFKMLIEFFWSEVIVDFLQEYLNFETVLKFMGRNKNGEQ